MQFSRVTVHSYVIDAVRKSSFNMPRTNKIHDCLFWIHIRDNSQAGKFLAALCFNANCPAVFNSYFSNRHAGSNRNALFPGYVGDRVSDTAHSAKRQLNTPVSPRQSIEIGQDGIG